MVGAVALKYLQEDLDRRGLTYWSAFDYLGNKVREKGITVRVTIRRGMTLDEIAAQFRDSRIPPKKIRQIVVELNRLVNSPTFRPRESRRESR